MEFNYRENGCVKQRKGTVGGIRNEKKAYGFGYIEFEAKEKYTKRGFNHQIIIPNCFVVNFIKTWKHLNSHKSDT